MQEMQEMWVQSLGWQDPIEEEMATNSSILAWKIPWTEELGGLQSMGSQRVRHDWATEGVHAYLMSLRLPCPEKEASVLMIWEQYYSASFYTSLIFIFICLFMYLAEPCLSWGLWTLLVEACGIWFPDQGLKPSPLHWECRVLATGPPGKSQVFLFFKFRIVHNILKIILFGYHCLFTSFIFFLSIVWFLRKRFEVALFIFKMVVVNFLD